MQAGKKAAEGILQIHQNVVNKLLSTKAELSCDELAKAISTDDIESVFKICEHLSANPSRGISKTKGLSPFDAKYRAVQ